MNGLSKRTIREACKYGLLTEMYKAGYDEQLEDFILNEATYEQLLNLTVNAGSDVYQDVNVLENKFIEFVNYMDKLEAPACDPKTVYKVVFTESYKYNEKILLEQVLLEYNPRDSYFKPKSAPAKTPVVKATPKINVNSIRPPKSQIPAKLKRAAVGVKKAGSAIATGAGKVGSAIATGAGKIKDVAGNIMDKRAAAKAAKEQAAKNAAKAAKAAATRNANKIAAQKAANPGMMNKLSQKWSGMSTKGKVATGLVGAGLAAAGAYAAGKRAQKNSGQ